MKGKAALVGPPKRGCRRLKSLRPGRWPSAPGRHCRDESVHVRLQIKLCPERYSPAGKQKNRKAPDRSKPNRSPALGWPPRPRPGAAFRPPRAPPTSATPGSPPRTNAAPLHRSNEDEKRREGCRIRGAVRVTPSLVTLKLRTLPSTLACSSCREKVVMLLVVRSTDARSVPPARRVRVPRFEPESRARLGEIAIPVGPPDIGSIGP